MPPTHIGNDVFAAPGARVKPQQAHLSCPGCAMCREVAAGKLPYGNGGLRDYGLRELIGDRRVFPGLLEAVLDLFAGNATPALWTAAGGRQGWSPAPRTTRDVAFAAHLLGVARAGSYPFLGPTPGCGCRRREHACAGLGAWYLCLDLDAKNGERDMQALATRAISVCLASGLRPFAFASRSGTGVHLYIFFDRVLPLKVVNAAGQAIRRAAGAERRCDVIPGSSAPAGLGTQHGLPLNPNDAEHAGGLLLDGQLRPIVELSRIVATLTWAHAWRSANGVVRALAGQPALAGQNLERALAYGIDGKAPAVAQVRPAPAPEVRPITPAPNPPTASKRADARIVKAMLAAHPQFRAAVQSAAGTWKGKRSARDAYLARFLARQGVSPDGIAAALRRFSPKVRELGDQGEVYARGLAAWTARHEPAPLPELPGAKVTFRRLRMMKTEAEIREKSCTMTDAHTRALWADRAPAPAAYFGTANPFWSASVQARLTGRRTARVDGPLLAWLIAYWVWGRGVHPRRRFFLGHAAIADGVGLSPAQVQLAVRRLTRDFGDVLRITPGVRHPTLRIATAFDVLGLPRADDETVCELESRNPLTKDPRAGILGRHVGPPPESLDERDACAGHAELRRGGPAAARLASTGADVDEAREPRGAGHGGSILVRGRPVVSRPAGLLALPGGASTPRDRVGEHDRLRETFYREAASFGDEAGA